jgi:hypothetical protein
MPDVLQVCKGKIKMFFKCAKETIKMIKMFFKCARKPCQMFVKCAKETIGCEEGARTMSVLAEQGVWATARAAPIAPKIAAFSGKCCKGPAIGFRAREIGLRGGAANGFCEWFIASE